MPTAMTRSTPASLAALLFAPDHLPPAETAGDVLKRIRFGLLALSEAPAGAGQTPAERLASDPVFGLALASVERFLDLGKWPEPGTLYDQVRAACDGLGLGNRGAPAAGLGVLHLVTAVERLVADPADLDAAGYADAAAAQAGQAGDDGYTLDSVAYLERLQSRVLGLPVLTRPD